MQKLKAGILIEEAHDNDLYNPPMTLTASQMNGFYVR